MSTNTQTTSLAQAHPGKLIKIATDPFTETFWQAAKKHKLTAPKCQHCGEFHFPPRPYCPKCQSKEFDWPEVSGKGTVYSFVICRRSPYPDVQDYNYVAAAIDLDDAPGVRLITNIIDVQPEAVAIGMSVSVCWQTIQDEWELPLFQAISQE